MAKLPNFQIRIVNPQGERIERLQKTHLVLGRSPESDLIIADNEVSRRHIEIKVGENSVEIIDLGSKNGSFIDGRRMTPKKPYTWRMGQVLRLGLATEQLELMKVGDVQELGGDGPPPTHSVSRKYPTRREPTKSDIVPVTIPAPVLNIDLNAKVPTPNVDDEPRENSIWLGLRNDVGIDPKKPNPAPVPEASIESPETVEFGRDESEDDASPQPSNPEIAATVDLIADGSDLEKTPAPGKPADLEESANPSLMKDLENRMSELIRKAELDAKNILNSAENNSVDVMEQAVEAKKVAEHETEQLNIEKARIDTQVRDLKAEVISRTDERKAVARELADAKLRLQQLREEKERYEAACKQLPMQIKGEIAELEDRHFQMKEKVAQADEEANKVASREAKDMVDKAKKQVELILAEGEMKAKAQREKLQVELADQRRAAELDLADLKLKQVAGIKSDQEQLDRTLSAQQEVAADKFIAALKVRMDGLAMEGDLSPEVRMLIATEVERLTGQFLGGGIQQGQGVVRPFPISPENETPIQARRFTLTSVAVSGVAMVLFAVVTWQVMRTRGGSLSVASVAVTKPVGAPAPAPAAVPTPPPVVSQAQTAPQAALPVEASTENVVDQVEATSVVEARTPTAESAEPFEPAAPVSSRPVMSTWNRVLNGSHRHKWSLQSLTFLRTLRLDRVKIARYQALENKLGQSLASRGRTVASERDRRRIEAQFARDASRLLGEKNWAKVLGFRDRFAQKNR